MRCHGKIQLASKAPLTIISMHIGFTVLLVSMNPSIFSNHLRSSVFILSFVLTILTYLMTSYTDPGFIYEILPRSLDSNGKDSKAFSKAPTSQFQGIDKRVDTDESNSNSNSENSDEKAPLPQCRFCTVCMIEQPVRSKHCRECRHCVALHDHHCPWIGVCIGEKNRRGFWWYLLFQFVLLCTASLMCLEILNNFEITFPYFLVATEFGIIILLTAMVGILLGFHTFLACRNQTTWEIASWRKIHYLKNWPKNSRSPFSKGVFSNLYSYCCKVIPDGYTIWELPQQLPK